MELLLGFTHFDILHNKNLPIIPEVEAVGTDTTILCLRFSGTHTPINDISLDQHEELPA